MSYRFKTYYNRVQNENPKPNKIRFGIFGIISVQIRTTSDIDILVRPTLENGTRIIKAFKDLKLGVKDILPVDFTIDQVFTFGMEPDAVDILTFSRGVLLDEIFDNAIRKKIDNLSIKIIDIKDLLKNKESLERSSEKNLIDQQDILALRRILKSR